MNESKVKQFKVASVSSNHNSFGLQGIILVSQSGEAWEVGRYFGHPNKWEKGMIVNAPVFGRGSINWAMMSCEIPRRLPNAPQAVAAEVWM